MANYVIFGAGRVGVSMSSYLRFLDHRVSLISHSEAKADADACIKEIEAADIVAAAVPDGRIAEWRDQWTPNLSKKVVIHFSGAARIDDVFPFHPLYSFPPAEVEPATMQQITFACPERGPAFGEVFPGATNPNFKIADEDRARYHALAVLSGNFAAYLWNETANEISAFSGLKPEAVMGGYLSSIIDRFLESPKASLTGPVARRDAETVEANLDALAATPKLKNLYKAFLNAAWPDYPS